MAALEYHLNARGYPGFTVPIASVGTYANNREVVPAHANVDSTGAEIGTVANPFNVNVVSGGGGGGGGAVTIADGADIAEGATTATVYTDVTGAASGTLVALNKGQYVLTAALSAKLPASLGAKTGATSLSVVPNTDTPFPVAAAVTTAAPTYTTGTNQALSLTTGGALRADTSGGVASGTADSGNATKIGGVYNSTLPTLTSGWRGDAQLTSRGSLYVTLANTGGVTPSSIGGSTDANSTSSSGMFGVSLGLMFNGASLDRVRKANLYARVPSSAASGNPAFLKASAGDVMQFWGQCGATATFLQIYNKTSAPVIGTDTPLITYPMAASGLFSQTIPVGGAYCSTGIAYAFTTDAAGTTAAAAAAVTAFMMLAA